MGILVDPVSKVLRGEPHVVRLVESGASAAVSASEAARRPRVQVHCLQDLHTATEAQ